MTDTLHLLAAIGTDPQFRIDVDDQPLAVKILRKRLSLRSALLAFVLLRLELFLPDLDLLLRLLEELELDCAVRWRGDLFRAPSEEHAPQLVDLKCE